jgi:hypothetical protein
MVTDDDDISIRSTEEMEKYECLRQQVFGHTRVYDVNLLERVGMDEEPPLILRTIGWGKLYRGGGWIERLKRWMDNYEHMQMEMQASIDSQTGTMHDLFSHFGINLDA